MFNTPDIWILHLLNGLDARNPAVDKFMHALCDDLFLRGAPLLLLFWLGWFAPGQPSVASPTRRARMLCGIAATCAATLLSVMVQTHVNVHIRPLQNPGLGVRIDSGTYLADWVALGHVNSFPSDTTVMYCGLAMVAMLFDRKWGLAALAWALVVIGIPRIYFGYHFPSDVLAGAVIGVVVPGLAMRSDSLGRLADRFLGLFQRREALLNALMFLFIFDMANLFQGMRYLAHGLHEAVLWVA